MAIKSAYAPSKTMAALSADPQLEKPLTLVNVKPRLRGLVAAAMERHAQAIARHKAYVREHREDLPEIRDRRWTAQRT